MRLEMLSLRNQGIGTRGKRVASSSWAGGGNQVLRPTAALQ